MKANRLLNEKSPYLLQHAYNPVDWYPWGEEAFRAAREQDKPIFLSIGYATCHWCHVMEHESFEDEAIAKLMNEAFICIKVDREERPDIDSIHMTVCQIMTGQGGWPLTILMTPEKHPFHAATYIPPESRYGRIGMKELVPRVAAMWKNRRAELLESANQIVDVLVQHHATGGGAELGPELLDRACTELMGQYDADFGGFGMQPKFPTPHRLVFLLRQGEVTGIAAAEHTLQEMRMGGIFDHIGFGFHRYSTDRRWLLPHFEKMLYDQALLALAYTEAYEKTGNPLYKQVVGEILEYVMRDMTSPGGGFYSAEDADSEGEEGLFYIWSADEMKSVLGNDYGFASNIWNVKDSGNFHDEATGKPTGMNIPYLSKLPAPEDSERLETDRTKLFAVREKRIHPLKDTKVLADWNGLMIAAFAKAGHVFEEQRYVEAAKRANAFVQTEMKRGERELWHRWREGDRAVPGHLEDYAFNIFGLIELYESTFDPAYLETALDYNTVLSESFIDLVGGGYFMTTADAEDLIIRPKELYDGAIPSGNSVQFHNLLRLARLTGNDKLEEQAMETGRAFGGMIERSPSHFAQALIGLQFASGEGAEIVVVGERENPATQAMLDHLHSVYVPGMVVLLKTQENAGALAELAPFTKEQKMLDGKTTVYLCRNHACEQPIVSLEMLQERLK